MVHPARKPKAIPQHETHDAFLLRMMAERKLNPNLLINIAEQTARRLLDNADNQMGAPALGRGTGIALQGQLHEYPTAIPDIKARIAENLERLYEPKPKLENKQLKPQPGYRPPTPKPGSNHQ